MNARGPEKYEDASGWLLHQLGLDALYPLTKLGKALGDLDIEVDVPDDIPTLEIKKGPISVQRFIHWHVFKAFHRPEMTLDEMNHLNFDGYAPRNAHRQSPEEVTRCCKEVGLTVERIEVEEAGTTITGRKEDAD